MGTAVTTSDVKAGEHVIRLHRAGPTGAEPILFLHGSGPGATGMSNFSRTIDAFSGDYDCLVIDQVGWGDSSHPTSLPAGGRMEQNAVASLALLDELGLDRVHVIGNSMGGAVMLHLLNRAPERFGRGIGLGAAGAGIPGGPTPAMMRLFRFYDDPTPASMKALIASMIDNPDLFGDRLDEIAADRLAVALRPEVRRSHELSFTTAGDRPAFLTEDELRGIDNEVLFVHGREDVTVPPEGSEWFARRLPNAAMYLMPHSAHWVQIEQAAKFETIARTFLSGRI